MRKHDNTTTIEFTKSTVQSVSQLFKTQFSIQLGCSKQCKTPCGYPWPLFYDIFGPPEPSDTQGKYAPLPRHMPVLVTTIDFTNLTIQSVELSSIVRNTVNMHRFCSADSGNHVDAAPQTARTLHICIDSAPQTARTA